MSDPLLPEADAPVQAEGEQAPTSADAGAPVADPELAALAGSEADRGDVAVPSDGIPSPAAASVAAAAPPAPSQPPMAPPPAAPVPSPALPVAPASVAPTPVAARMPARRRRGLLYYSRRLVTLFFGILEVLLLLRILLLFLNANETNDIVDWIVSVTQPFVDPFLGMFNLDNIEGSNGAIVDVAAIVALIAWILIETLILAVLRLFDRGDR